jgi:hypothetical protein
MKLFAQGLRPPSLPACDMLALPDVTGALADTLDEATLRYVEAMRLPFDQLRQAAGQIAGVLVLAMTVTGGAAGHPMLDLADTAQREAQEAISRARPPPRGMHHHRHLVDAARDIATALDAARRHMRGADDAATDAVMQPLRAGYRSLQWAAGALPGFEVVAFSQGCCAQHPARLRTNEQSIRE